VVAEGREGVYIGSGDERRQAIGFAEQFVGRYGLGIAFIPWCGAGQCPRVSIFAPLLPRGSSKPWMELESDLMAEVMAFAAPKSLVFSTEDVRYEWLTKVLAVMEGEFDEKTGRATWNVYVPAGSR
jgi:hypothetical protein